MPEALTAASAFNGNAMEWKLSGGEDHAFAATLETAKAVPRDTNIKNGVIGLLPAE